MISGQRFVETASNTTASTNRFLHVAPVLATPINRDFPAASTNTPTSSAIEDHRTFGG